MGAVTEGCVLERPELDDHDDDDDGLEHYCCRCNPDIALCGVDLEDAEYLPPGESPNDCVVCLDLKDKPCSRCGK